MDGLVTLNLGEYLCGNARASMIAAAKRWHADYVEILSPFRADLNPCYTKLSAFNRLTSYGRIAYFDADMLIRADAPSPFDLLGENRLVAVKDISDARFPEGSPIRDAIQAEAHIPWHGVMESLLRRGTSLEAYLSTFFNAGFLVYSPPRCRSIFEVAFSLIPEQRSRFAGIGRYEQALLNYLACGQEGVALVSEEWNYLCPDLSSGRMDHWVYHFTGLNSKHIKPAIHSFPWARK
jgi:hypothetical protein